jgi:hypothetical protein
MSGMTSSFTEALPDEHRKSPVIDDPSQELERELAQGQGDRMEH